MHDSGNAGTHNNIGMALLRQGKIDRAVHHFKQAIRLDQYNPAAHRNFNLAVSLQQKIDRGLMNLSNVLNINPETMDRDMHVKLLKMKKIKFDDVIHQYVKALSPQPGFSAAELNIGNYPKAATIIKSYNRLLALYQTTG